MTALNILWLSLSLWMAVPQVNAQSTEFDKLAAECASDVHLTTLKGLVKTESSFNPYAIGVVGGHLLRQPQTMLEAISTAHELENQSVNFSMGLGQINRYNLAAYGETVETIFEPCRNLKAGSAILKGCFQRAKKQIGDDQQALKAAFSCYYSGNFKRGFKPDQKGQPSYVQKVVANATANTLPPPIPVVPAVQTNTDHSNAAIVLSTPAAASNVKNVKPAADALPKTKANSQTQWVIFTEEKPASNKTETVVADAKEPPVKVQLLTTKKELIASINGADQLPPQAEQKTVIQPSAPLNAQSNSSFVQFIN